MSNEEEATRVFIDRDGVEWHLGWSRGMMLGVSTRRPPRLIFRSHLSMLGVDTPEVNLKDLTEDELQRMIDDHAPDLGD